MDAATAISLADYRRRVAEMYAAVRAGHPGEGTWQHWRDSRDELFRDHPQSALPHNVRVTFSGLQYFDYNPAYRFELTVNPALAVPMELTHSGTGTTGFIPLGTVDLEPLGDARLTIYWLEAYGGGVFLPFADATSGSTTYGGGRYVIDTVKGADLGSAGNRLIVDFNYAYHPSCVYSSAWSCPIAPPVNRLENAIAAGERLRS